MRTFLHCKLFPTITKKHNYGHLFHNFTNDVRVRFAPSPTGHLHLGGLRTALYNYLFARANNGKFILRIEDTDQTRLVPGACEQIKSDMLWAGIHIDEGPGFGGHLGPYIQSERLDIYKEQVKVLLEDGSAYHCFCSNKRLDMLRRDALRTRQVPKYDNKCRFLTKDEVQKKLDQNEPNCIRFKLKEGVVSFNDLVYGKINQDIALNEGDPVIIKTDGYPTYHFANVVDDHFMKISHVLRGVEWQVSTTKHILLYRAFCWEPPSYAHLPLLLNRDGTKLSKRQGDIKISHYIESNIFPLALLNFIVHSGGGFEKDLQRGIKPKSYTMDELIKQFQIENVNPHSGKLMPERLLEFNRLELARKLESEVESAELVQDVKEMIKMKYKDRVNRGLLQLDEDYIRTILVWLQDRISRLEDLFSKDLEFIWIVPKNVGSVEKNLMAVIVTLTQTFSKQDIFSKDSLNKLLKEFAKQNNVKYSVLMKTLRTVLSGLEEGPSVAEMIEILGKQNTLERLNMYIKNNR